MKQSFLVRDIVKQFIEHFGINHEQMKWERTTIHENGSNLEMIAHKGDTICFGDFNHKHPGDKERFDLICLYANAAPKINDLLEACTIVADDLERHIRQLREQGMTSKREDCMRKLVTKLRQQSLPES